MIKTGLRSEAMLIRHITASPGSPRLGGGSGAMQERGSRAGGRSRTSSYEWPRCTTPQLHTNY